MANKKVVGKCKLCGKSAELCLSHILPAFAFRWLKKRSGSGGHIRNIELPNRRVQDGVKEHWLCVECEQLFSVEEAAFASKVFHPFDRGEIPIRYGPYMLRFCTSVSWRVLKFAFGRNPEATYSPAQLSLVEQAEKRWRDFLLGRVRHPGEFEQHLIAWSTISETSIPNLPTNMNRFLTGPITLDIVGSGQRLMTFAKLGPFMIFGHIQSRKRTWEGSKIGLKDGKFPSQKYVLPPALLPLFHEKAGLIGDGWSKLSDQQAQLIDETILAKGEQFFDTPQGQAVLADAEMFGINSVMRKKS